MHTSPTLWLHHSKHSVCVVCLMRWRCVCVCVCVYVLYVYTGGMRSSRSGRPERHDERPDGSSAGYDSGVGGSVMRRWTLACAGIRNWEQG